MSNPRKVVAICKIGMTEGEQAREENSDGCYV